MHWRPLSSRAISPPVATSGSSTASAKCLFYGQGTPRRISHCAWTGSPMCLCCWIQLNVLLSPTLFGFSFFFWQLKQCQKLRCRLWFTRGCLWCCTSSARPMHNGKPFELHLARCTRWTAGVRFGDWTRYWAGPCWWWPRCPWAWRISTSTGRTGRRRRHTTQSAGRRASWGLCQCRWSLGRCSVTSWTAAIGTATFGDKSHPYDRSHPRSMVEGPKFNLQTTKYFSDSWGAVGKPFCTGKIRCLILSEPKWVLIARLLSIQADTSPSTTFSVEGKTCVLQLSQVQFLFMAWRMQTLHSLWNPSSCFHCSCFDGPGQTLLLPRRRLGLVQELVFSWQFHSGTTIVTHFSQ